MSPAILTIIIFFLCILSFIWEKIPLAVTCLLGGIALALLGIIDYVDIYSNMGTQVVAIVIGTSMVGLGLESAGISDMVGSALRRTGIAKNERLFITIIVLVTALLSAFLSNSAVIAMFIPIIQGMSKKSQGIVKQKHALLAAGLGSAAGGGLTLVGTAPIVTASSIVENSGLPGTRAFTFLEVGYSMLPVVILMALYFATFGYNLQQRVLADLPDNPLDTLMSGETEQASTAVPVWKKAVALAAALFMVVGFAFNLFDIGAVSLMAAAIMLVCGVIPWKVALRDMDWNTVLVLAFSAALAAGLNESGGGAMIAQGIVSLFGGADANPAVLLFVCVAVGAVLTNFMGNAALVIAMIPISLEVALICGANPMCFALATTVSCMLAFSTPIGTACVTQTLVGGYRYHDFVKIGLPINILAILAVGLVSPIVYGL